MFWKLNINSKEYANYSFWKGWISIYYLRNLNIVDMASTNNNQHSIHALLSKMFKWKTQISKNIGAKMKIRSWNAKEGGIFMKWHKINIINDAIPNDNKQLNVNVYRTTSTTGLSQTFRYECATCESLLYFWNSIIWLEIGLTTSTINSRRLNSERLNSHEVLHLINHSKWFNGPTTIIISISHFYSITHQLVNTPINPIL